MRAGLANLKDSYGLLKDGELWLLNAHISPYEHGGYANHDPVRTRIGIVHLGPGAFHRAHQARYGYAQDKNVVEIVSARVRSIGVVEKVKARRSAVGRSLAARRDRSGSVASAPPGARARDYAFFGDSVVPSRLYASRTVWIIRSTCSESIPSALPM